jgi:hypothetical protein
MINFVDFQTLGVSNFKIKDCQIAKTPLGVWVQLIPVQAICNGKIDHSMFFLINCN